MNRGAAYLAVGKAHAKEASLSAQSLKQHMPDLPTALFTDVPEAITGFDHVFPIECNSYDRSYNILVFKNSPFDQTLYLDTDTFVANDLHDAFRLLDRFDVGAVHAPQHQPKFRVDGAPPSFPQYNGGVLLVRKNTHTERFLDHWMKMYMHDLEQGWEKLYPKGSRKKRFVHCQPSLRQALYESENIRIATLPSEYNCRLAQPAVLMEPVRILHGTYPDMAGIARLLNAQTGPRLVYMRGSRVIIRPKPFLARALECFMPRTITGRG